MLKLRDSVFMINCDIWRNFILSAYNWKNVYLGKIKYLSVKSSLDERHSRDIKIIIIIIIIIINS